MKSSDKLKIVTVVGTRPEIIRLSRVIATLDKFTVHILVNTMQNYADNLNKIFFEDLGIRSPDYIFDTTEQTVSGELSRIFAGTEKVLQKERPDGLLVLGDTNSGLCALIAKKLNIPIFHMEAGNRCFDDNVPEEINRKVIDHISEINLPYTENSRHYLIEEGIAPGSIYVTGSPLREVYEYYRERVQKSPILTSLQLHPRQYLLVSLHRQENVNDPKTLKHILQSLQSVSAKLKKNIIFSVHPRTQSKMKDLNRKLPNIRFLNAFGFLDYCKLQQNAYCVLSDSGSIQEESAIQHFPAIQLRMSSERPEAIEAGSIVVCGHDASAILEAIDISVDEDKNVVSVIPQAYMDSNVSIKVAKIIIGAASIMRQKRKTIL